MGPELPLTQNTSSRPRKTLFQDFVDLLLDFGLLEGLALNFVVALGVDQKFGAQDHNKLPHVHLGDEDVLVALQDIAEIFRKRIQVAQMNVAYGLAFVTRGFQRGGDWAVR
jgi:hypothetical protein